MSDSGLNLDSSAYQQNDPPPEFGLVDVIEAFTAMRHECRGHTKESRALAELTRSAVDSLQEMEAKLSDIAGTGSEEARKLALLIADTDAQLTRAVAASTKSESSRTQQADADWNAVRRCCDGMNPLARWFCRPLLTLLTEQRRVREQITGSPAVEGLNLMVGRLRRAMQEHQIERLDVLGQEFVAETMNAIGTVETEDHPSGHVAEQLAPAYRWRGKLLQFADVRVST